MVPLWKKGQFTSLTRGAVMAFESGHGMSADGTAGRKVWLTLLSTVAAHKAHKGHYDYIMVDSTDRPQMLSAWQDGKVIYRTPATPASTHVRPRRGPSPSTCATGRRR